MIEYSNGGILVEPGDSLPELPTKINRLYLDFETTSKHPSLDSLNPHYHCWPCGVAVTWDDMPKAYYVPCSHADTRWNYDWGRWWNWLADVYERSKSWVNHHVKYDWHVANNACKIRYDGELVCTLQRAKIKNSDMQFVGGYGLDNLSLLWLLENIRHYEAALKPYLHKNKDYGRIPADIMGEYACQDVLTNRRLDKYLVDTMHPESAGIVETETKLTSILCDMESTGVLVYPEELRTTRLVVLNEMLEQEQRLHELVGRPFLPTSNDDCYDVLCNQYGLPILEYTEAENASFDKAVLKTYAQRVDAPTEVVELIIAYRENSTFKGLFLETYEELAIPCDYGAILHGTFNQNVRSGRMSCSVPNMQQLKKTAKKLIHPRPGKAFLSADASQIEFRTIVHYIRDAEAIAAYAKNPDVDYHQWVADVIEIERKPAKTINFQTAFGGGKKKMIAALSTNKDVVGYLMKEVEAQCAADPTINSEALFRSLCARRGEQVFDKYHESLPGIRSTSYEAGRICRSRGYVRNLLGRRRYMPQKRSHTAFNALNQSLAADIIKQRMVAVYPVAKAAGIDLLLQVHDELVFEGDIEAIEDPRTQRDLVGCLEDFSKLNVPIRFNYGTSLETWYEASSDEAKTSIPVDEAKNYGHLEHLLP